MPFCGMFRRGCLSDIPVRYAGPRAMLLPMIWGRSSSSRALRPHILCALIHPSAWKGRSTNFCFTAFSEVDPDGWSATTPGATPRSVRTRDDSAFLPRRSEQDLVDLHVFRLAHGEEHHTGEGVGGNGDTLVESIYVLGDIGFRNAAGQLGRNSAGRDDGGPDVVGLDLLPQRLRDDAYPVLGRGVDRAARIDRVAGDRRDVDDVAALLLFHVRQHGGDAVEDPLEVHIDRAVPVLDLERLERRERHQAGVVDDRVDAPMGLHGVVHEMPDLLVVAHVGLHDGLVAERELAGERLEPFETPRAQHELRPFPRETPGGGLAKPAARPGDYDHLVLNPLCQNGLLCLPGVYFCPRIAVRGRGAGARSPLAVDPLLHLRRIPVAPHLDARDGHLNVAEVVGCELYVGRADVLLKAVWLRRA